MRPKTALKQLAPLLKAVSFTSQQATKLGVSSATLGHYIASGELERLGRGIYRAADAPTAEDFRWEDLVSAAQSVRDGVICLTSALAFYELTEEVPRQHWIAIKNSTRHRAPTSVKVIRMRNLELGRTEISVSGIQLSIFDRERTIVDAFRYLSQETALKALKIAISKTRSKKIDVEKIRKYGKLLRVKLEPYLLALTT